MITSAKNWIFSHMAYVLTPESSLMVLPNRKPAPIDPPTHPLWAGTLKTVVWIMISIGISVLVSRQL